jgi:hypothetical protein
LILAYDFGNYTISVNINGACERRIIWIFAVLLGGLKVPPEAWKFFMVVMHFLT